MDNKDTKYTPAADYELTLEQWRDRALRSEALLADDLRVQQLEGQTERLLETLDAVVEFLEPQACTDCACEGSNPVCNMLNEIERVIAEVEGR